MGRIEDIAQCYAMADRLRQCKGEVLDLLTDFESYETAVDEWERSISCLDGVYLEARAIRQAHVKTVCSFLPVNLPLYSLVLFGAIPSLYADKVFVRAPATITEETGRIFEAVGMRDHFPRVGLYDLSRADFAAHFAGTSDVILFTGTMKNARAVRQACPQALFVYNGAGVNPIVVGPDADVEDCLQRVARTRIFNSGQDCAGPDVIIVHENNAREFRERLFAYLDQDCFVGSYKDPQVRIGRLLNADTLRKVERRLAAERDNIVYGGAVDHEEAVVWPTVLQKNIGSHADFFEFFSPVFNLLTYRTNEDLEQFFDSPDYRARAMYASLFGAPVPMSLLDSTSVLRNRTVLEVEQGNLPYGGFGHSASFVSYGSELSPQPVLISEVVANWYRNGAR